MLWRLYHKALYKDLYNLNTYTSQLSCTNIYIYIWYAIFLPNLFKYFLYLEKFGKSWFLFNSNFQNQQHLFIYILNGSEKFFGIFSKNLALCSTTFQFFPLIYIFIHYA